MNRIERAHKWTSWSMCMSVWTERSSFAGGCGRARRGQESASFEYDEGWLRAANRFSLEPALSLGPGSFHTGQGKALFGAIGDSAPDRWGRMLMARAERSERSTIC
jgi:hypothetical protein